jgi:hypothetical protein
MRWKVLSTNKIKGFRTFLALFSENASLCLPNNDSPFSPNSAQKQVICVKTVQFFQLTATPLRKTKKTRIFWKEPKRSGKLSFSLARLPLRAGMVLSRCSL